MTILSILIPVYGQQAFTKQCLLDLKSLPEGFEIIVWDNASTDSTKTMMEELMKDWSGPELRYIENPINIGFGRAMNQLYKLASSNNVLFLNNDIRITKKVDWWSEPLALIESGSIVGTQTGLLDDDFNFVREGKDNLSNTLTYLSGWWLMGSKKTLDKLKSKKIWSEKDQCIKVGTYADGPFPEELFNYFEDCWLSWEARRQGISLIRIDVPFFHFGRQTGKKMNMSEMYQASKLKFKKFWKSK
jgi:GT2 family glycosyltransferase